MILTIWRHGEAGSAVTDRQRQLTGQGRDDISFACHQYHEHCSARSLSHPELILFSEWQRTTETADIIAGAFSHALLESCDALIPGRKVSDVDVALGNLALSGLPEHLLLVSHQPLVSSLVDYYLGEYGRVAPLLPGGLACMTMDTPAAGCGSLLFSAQPPEYEAVHW